ncbi:ATP-binding cassette subfamily C protein CydC [Breoghania corrubedonensis]|uniref:ATP-binding cassette subfamily C protein CydC n=1 Tax=Breoghania corrubedonensis TaxID=665038 RepID=A0A2T5VA72_9HYPH|nr:thiol reductant ABC exporter subunit CydC [Breoghania corrubedonensis]PTW60650.1 ATP-binding cassette subfamily C protein CydC [Breoghania corrubedonensis]
MKDFLRVLRLMRPQAGWMALSIALAALATLAHVALMATSGWFITAMAAAGLAGVSMNYFTPAAMIRAFAIVRTGGRYVERLVGHEATLKFVASLRPWLFGRLEPLAPAALEDERSGDLMTRLRGDIDRLEFAFLRILQPMVVAVIVIGIGIAYAAFHDAAIAMALAVLAFAAGLVLPLLVGRLSAPSARRVTANSSDLNALLVEHLEARAELDIYDPGHRHRAAVLETSDALIDDERKVASLAGLASAGVGLCANLALVAVIAIGGPQIAAGTLGGPDLVMLALMGLALFEVVGPLPVAMQTLPGFLASARRIFSLADRAPPVPAVAMPESVPETGALTFENVGFTYPGAGAAALSDVSFTLRPGKRIAIVGPSGSGKSSLVSLALRYRAASEGKIGFAGQPVERFEPEALRRRFAVLAQSDHLFSTTIDDNLRLADPAVSRGRIDQACALAGILDFIKEQPDGFDTYVGAHGAKVSGGQGRRLGLARALLKDAPFLILDEPTEGLDPETEERVLEGVLEATRERGVLLITHSHACLELMDEVIVLEAGRIVERGAPGEVFRRT